MVEVRTLDDPDLRYLCDRSLEKGAGATGRGPAHPNAVFFLVLSSNAFQESLPCFAVGWLGVPKVEMLAHLLEKCDAYWFAPKRQNAACKIEEIEDIKILAASESTLNALIYDALFITANSGRREEDVLDFSLPAFS